MSSSEAVPYARFDSFDGGGRSWELRRPIGVVEAWRPGEVVEALGRVEEAAAGGAFAAGYVSYEAAPGLEGSLATREALSHLPLVWFGLFAERHDVVAPLDHGPVSARGVDELVRPWTPALSPERYAERIAAIRELIAAGDTYQVNFTFPLRGSSPAGDLELYTALGRAQRARYCALLRLPGRSILSISPELFFRWSGGELELRPMKGTRPRGRWAAEDRERSEELYRSEKDRAENLMIVDLLRNDAGRVAEFGSVEVTRLFEVESYPTVHQLTSSIRARTRPGTSLVELFQALFPSGSVTGAPKVRTMQIIAELESSPRGVYTGAIGIVSSDEALFNVPIRTLLLAEDGAAEMWVGSGVTYDSDAAAEYAECLQKAAFSRFHPQPFSLLETLLFEPASGFLMLRGHLERMGASAAYFGYPFDEEEAARVLAEAVEGAADARRVRLLLSDEGAFSVESSPLAAQGEPLRGRLALERVDSADLMLYHKTTRREPYERRLGERPGYDEVLLVNERGELTEFANGNLVVRLDGVDFTPPLDCGLLPGVMRQELIEEGQLRERVLRPEELRGAEGVFRINSVRGWARVEVDAV